MRALLTAVLLFVCFATPALVSAQQATATTTAAPPSSDPRAGALARQALASMGGAVPLDAVATGSIMIVAGSLTTSGTIRVQTRGLNQSSDEIQTPDISETVIFSNGQAREIQTSGTNSLPLERAVTSQSPYFPAALLAGALANKDVAFQWIGAETVDGSAVQHLRFWNTFASTPDLSSLASFSATDIWISAATGLPYKLAYVEHEGGGDAPQVAVEVYYSDYRNVNGVLFPFSMKRNFNGTPWATISIQTLTINNGLSNNDFQVQ